jgi:preprotein translocase subunit YajC
MDHALPLPTADIRMTALVLALQAAPPSARTGGGTMLILQFALILGIIYFLMIRPQQKQRKQHESTIMGLKKGDEVVTVGGIVGRVVHIKESLKDGSAVSTLTDHVTIQSGESRLVIERGRIAKIGATTTGAPAA